MKLDFVFLLEALTYIDLSQEPSLSEIFNMLKLNPQSTLDKAHSNEVVTEYKNNTETAGQKKFGSPTFIIDNEIFWGDNRMEDSIKWLKKLNKIIYVAHSPCLKTGVRLPFISTPSTSISLEPIIQSI